MPEVKIEIILPLYYNDKSPIEDQMLAEAYDRIRDQFIFLSIDNSTIDGYWMDPQKKVYVNDENRKVWVIVDDTENNRKKCQLLKKGLEELLKQDEILIIVSQVSRIL